MGQRPTCHRTSSLARSPQTCTFWSKLWPVQIFVLAPKISQIPVLCCSKIGTFTQGDARCRVRLRSNFRHVAAAFLSHTGRFVIESICQENNIISNQWLPDLERYQKIGFVCFKKTEQTSTSKSWPTLVLKVGTKIYLNDKTSAAKFAPNCCQHAFQHQQ